MFAHCFLYLIGLNGKPTMPQLLNFKDGTKTINIPLTIGTHYPNFGTLLLGDYGYVSDLEQQYNRRSEKINSQILQDWLEGKGKEPKSWATLVGVLRDIEMGELANQIETSITRS